MSRADRDAWMEPHPSLSNKPKPPQFPKKSKPQPPAEFPSKLQAQPSRSEPNPPPAAVEPNLKRQPKPKLLQHGKRQSASDRWFAKAAREGIALHFWVYGKEFDATIAKNAVYDYHLHIDDRVEVIPKLEIKFCCKAELLEQIKGAMTVDTAVASKSLQPIKPRKKRYRVSDHWLRDSRREQREVTATMRGGEVFRGRIEWYSRYEIKLQFSDESKVILMRHALLRME